MPRRLLFVLVGVASAAMLAPTRAAEKDLSGNYQLTTVTAGGESTACILKFETKDGKPTASIVFAPENATDAKVTDVRVTETRVSVTVRMVRTFGKQKATQELAFIGERGTDAKTILGSIGTASARGRAKLTATTKDTLAKDELVVKTAVPEPMIKAQQLGNKAAVAQNKYALEKDAEKKKELLKEMREAAKEATEKQPALFREVIEKHADTPAAFDAALSLFRGSARNKPSADDAAAWVKLIQKQGAPYGAVFTGVTLAPIAETLAGQGLEAVALSAIEPSAKALGKDEPVQIRVAVLSAYQTALAKSGKSDAAKTVGTELAKLEAALDAEYLKAVPPFKPTPYTGRKDKAANQVAVMELFTGAQCPPCVAADAAFDALLKTYKPTDVVLIQYHVHIPGPDPLTIPDSVARFDYYQKEFPEDVRGAPTTTFNGLPFENYDKDPMHRGGGPMTNSENKYNQYRAIIDPILEKSTAVKMAGKATRSGDKIDIQMEVNEAAGDDMRLRLLVVEESIHYVGGNQMRFHHHVVRAMPGGADGVAIKDKAFKHAASTDLAQVRKDLTKYLDEYGQARPFPKPDRPMDMKELKVIALVQNDKTKEIVQAVQIEVEGKVAGGP